MTALPPDVVADLERENARLQAELRTARDRQAGSAEILRAVADTSGDAERSLHQIAETTARLFGASSVTVRTAEGDEWTRTIYVGASAQRISTEVSPEQLRIGANNLPGTVLRENRQIHIPDLANLDPSMADWPGLRVARTAGARTAVGTPLRREGKAIGTLIVHRERLAPFTEEELALLQSFADQAVIAIENARLFNETQEALERQTATAEILKVIASSPSDVQPVFEAIAASANRLIGGFSTAVYSLVDDMQHLSAFTPSNPAADAALQALFPRPLSMQPWAEQTRNGEIVHVPDIEADPTVPAKLLDVWRMRGFRGFIRVPLLRDRTTVGMISVSRVEPGPFAAHHIQLLQTFADQAVIAIENVRLFTETQEALERQTATAEILKVIASSPSDVQPVFDVIVERAVRLCGGRMGRVYRFDGAVIQMVAGHGLSAPGLGKVQQVFPRPATDDTIAGQVMLSHRPYFVTDIQQDDSVPALSRQMIEALGTRSQVTVPMLRAGEAIGAITVGWAEPGAFGDQQVSLLQTFADQAVIAIENVRLFNETKEALERQTATADILKVIASSPSDVQPVFEAIATSSNRLIGGFSTAVLRFTGGVSHLAAFTPTTAAANEALKAAFPRSLAEFPPFELIRNGEVAQIVDTESEPGLRDIARLRGFRSVLFAPLMSNGAPIGAINVTRHEPGTFVAHHVQLLQTFADQAVIAIENVRLFNETREALERQTATADILKVIASSPSDVQPVFEAIATSSNRLIGGFSTAVLRFIGDELHLAAFTPTNAAADEALKASFPRPLAEFPPFMLVRDGETVRIVDTEADDVPQLIKELARLRGYRSMLYTPLMSGGTPIGLISVTRAEPGTFAAHHMQLVRTFADQAVIAIENVRLFDEVQAKTRDLTEALTYQTGSSNILSVIASSPTDVEPVLKAIVESACELCEAYDAVVLLKDGDDLRFSAHHGPIPINIEKWPINRNWVTGRAFVDQKPVHVRDLLSDEGANFPDGRELSQHAATEVRSILSVPLLRENESIGAILLRRTEVKPFSDKQITLLQTFANQAVIAIGNVRLFDEVQAKTRDLTEALTYQTGSSNILSVIASSPTDVGPVLKAIVESACELCDAYDAIVRLKNGDDLQLSAHHGPIPTSVDILPITRDVTAGRAFLDRKPVHVHDLLATEGAQFPKTQQMSRLEGGHRTVLSVPLLREGESIGVIVLRRIEVHPFSDKQIALLQTFADQAVIAIGNVRLFDEVQAKTRDLSESLDQQTATSEVLEVISSSPGELAPVFQKMLENATRICGANFGTMNLYDGERFQNVALYNTPEEFAEELREPIRPHPKSGLSTVARTHQAIQIEDLRTQPPYLEGDPAVLAMSDLAGARTIVIVPMLRENELVGTIAIYRQEVRPFTDKQVDLVANFAKQAVIAIENTRLLKELRRRTDDLTESLEQQTATSEVLQVISSTPGDLEPVFKSMLENATRICGANFGQMNLYEEGSFRRVADYNMPAAYAAALERTPFQPHPQSGLGTVARTHQMVHIEDIRTLPPYLEGNPSVVEIADLAGARTYFVVPMLKENELIGAITIYRQEVKPFTEKQTELVANFANQAVIAIENTRLLKELRERTDDLSESLQQQTATADVLKVISASPGELEPVFQAMLDNAVRLCEAEFAMLFLYEGNEFRAVGKWNLPPAYGEFLGKNPIIPDPKIPLGRVVMTKKPVQIADVLVDQSYIERFPGMVGVAELGGARTLLQVPMLKENELVGTIGIYRQEVRPFTDKQIALVQNFAAQAVIAIENARLLNELRQRTDDLTASLDDLRNAQDRLVQTEKLASLGQLTAGIAHEIKNPLNFVNNFSALSVELTDELNDVLKSARLTDNIRKEVHELTGLLKDNLGKVVQHGKRADSIVKNMLLHSREGSGDHRPADVNALVDESLNLAYHGARAEKPQFNVTLQRNFDPNAGMIEAFPQEITRVFLNLISNGFYAVTKRKVENGGTGFEPVVSATTKDRGNQVEIRIRDNGTGIPPEVMDKMFNPFFTTKPAGEGTGLGLSMSHDIIVKQHGGTIDVVTEPGQFTEFRIVLPRTSNISDKSGG